MIGIHAGVVERSNDFRGKGAEGGVVGMCSNGVQAVANRLAAAKHSNSFKCFTVPVSHESPNAELTGRRRQGALAARCMMNHKRHAAKAPCRWRCG